MQRLLLTTLIILLSPLIAISIVSIVLFIGSILAQIAPFLPIPVLFLLVGFLLTNRDKHRMPRHQCQPRRQAKETVKEATKEDTSELYEMPMSMYPRD